jgi:hypothetical protein
MYFGAKSKPSKHQITSIKFVDGTQQSRCNKLKTKHRRNPRYTRTPDIEAVMSDTKSHWVCKSVTGEANLDVAAVRGPPFDILKDMRTAKHSMELSTGLEHALNATFPIFSIREMAPREAQRMAEDPRKSHHFDLPRPFRIINTAFLVAKQINEEGAATLTFATSLHTVRPISLDVPNLRFPGAPIEPITLHLTRMWVDLSQRGTAP